MILNPPHPKRQALTRLDVALGVLTLGILAAIVCPKVFARMPYLWIASSMQSLSSLEVALDAYQHDIGHFSQRH
jgi:hypothetical protein